MVSSSSKMSLTCSPSATVRRRLCSMTRARNAGRSRAYASSVSKLSRSIRAMASDPVRHAQQRERMRLLRPDFAGLANALLDLPRRDRAVLADPVRLSLGHRAEHGAPDLHRVGEVLLLDAPGSVVPGAALHGAQLRPGNQR